MNSFIFDLQRFITGTSGNDNLHYDGYSDMTINASFGDDTVYTDNGSRVYINGGFGDDSIFCRSNYSTVEGNYGNDTISNITYYSSISGGEGDDSIYNNSYYSTITGGHGNDKISFGAVASGNIIQFAAGDNNDTIYNWREGNSISLPSWVYYTRSTIGTDVIISIPSGGAMTLCDASYKFISIIGGTPANDSSGGDDSQAISNYGKYSVVSGTSSDDTLSNYAGGATLQGGAGDDSIYNSTSSNYTINNGYGYVTIDAGAGNDTIYSNDPYVSINAGSGNDSINAGYSWSGRTIRGGEGNDTIYGNTISSGYGILYQYASGDGNDLIQNWSSSDTLSLSNGASYSTIASGSDVLVSIASSGTITLDGARYRNINITSNNSTVGKNFYNYGKNSLVSGSDSNDTIKNYAGGATLQGGAGDDSIYNSTSSSYTINSRYGYVTVDAGAGNDTIYSNDPRVSINAGAGNDSIYLGNWSRISVKGGTGNDTVYTASYRSNGILYQYGSDDGNDFIQNWSANDTLSLSNDASYSTIASGSDVLVSIAGSGTITLGDARYKNINITGGTSNDDGDDSSAKNLYNYGKNSLVSGSSGNDTINNYAGGATLRGGNGDDSIYNSTYSNYTINSSYGYVTVDAGAGNDTIYSNDPHVSINADAGNDKISLGSSWNGISVKGGAGNDTVYTTSYRTSGILYQYSSGDGSDYITNWAASDTLSLSSGANWSTVASGDNILVKIGTSKITLGGARGKNLIIYPNNNTSTNGRNIYNATNNTLITGSNYADTISNSLAGGVTINAGKGNDSIYNYADKVTVNAGAGKDTLTGGYSNSKISGNDGNDLISLTGNFWRNTISGGAGKDTIYAGSDEHSVSGGAGADKISLTGNKLTVKGGTGNDTIYGSTSASHLYQYTKGDGNDLIYNYGSNDSITISGSTWSTSRSSNDILVRVANSGTITLKGASGKTLNIYPARGTTDTGTSSGSDSEITPQEVIKKFMKALTTTSYSGIGALNQAVSVASGGYFDNINTAITQMAADCRNSSNATAFLENYCDIDLNNYDTGAITGSDAGGSTTRNAENIVPESGSLDNSFNRTSFTTNYGLTFNLSKNNPTPDELHIWRALKTWWGNESLKLIKNSYDYSFNDSDTTVNQINVKFEESYAGGYLAYTSYDGRSLTLGINKAYYNNFASDDFNGESPQGQGYLDRTVAHELTHAVMMSKLGNDFSDLPQFITEGTAELVHGIDDERESTISYLAGNSSHLQNSLSLMPGTGGQYEYAAGYMFLRYLAKQGSAHYGGGSGSGSLSILNTKNSNALKLTKNKSLLTVGKDFNDNMLDLTSATKYASVKSVNASSISGGITIVGNKKANSILAGFGNDTISANKGNDTVLGGKGADIIFGNAGNDLIRGDDGNDTLYGSDGKDTLTGGKGKDIFVHTADSDYITDYTVGEDKIKFVSQTASVTSSSVKGNDVVLKVGDSDSITIVGGKNQRITTVNYLGRETTKVYGNSSTSSNETLTISNSSKSAMTLSSAYTHANASSRTKAIKITGNSLANSIRGGSSKDTLYGGKGSDSIIGNAGADKLYGQDGADYLSGGKGNDLLKGGAGKDTLWGGAGSDSLYGGDGNDTFLYKPGEGKDTIFDYKSGDILQIVGGSFSNSRYSNGTLALTVGSGSVTFKNVTTSTSFNINDKSYRISGSKLARR